MTELCVRFFAQEGLRHDGRLVHEWLFDQAQTLGIAGGTAVRASAGFGRHGLRADHFFELAGRLPETVEFFADAARVQALIDAVGRAGLRLPYVTHPVSHGITGV